MATGYLAQRNQRIGTLVLWLLLAAIASFRLSQMGSSVRDFILSGTQAKGVLEVRERITAIRELCGDICQEINFGTEARQDV